MKFVDDVQQRDAVLGRGHPVTAAQQQLPPKPFFQLADITGQLRLTDIHAQRGLANTAGAQDLAQTEQRLQRDGVIKRKPDRPVVGRQPIDSCAQRTKAHQRCAGLFGLHRKGQTAVTATQQRNSQFRLQPLQRDRNGGWRRATIPGGGADAVFLQDEIAQNDRGQSHCATLAGRPPLSTAIHAPPLQDRCRRAVDGCRS